jgi:undecaprenyl diphosphate synthase
MQKIPSLEGVTIPGHIAIIMDGNGRWAQQHRLGRIKGHQQGARVVREITEESARLGVKRLTLYAFSSENWRRPPKEIKALMRLLKRYLVKERPTIMKNNIRFKAIGRLYELPQDVQKELEITTQLSSQNTGMVLCLALNYGGRTEIVDAVKGLLKDVLAKKTDIFSLDERMLSRYMYDENMQEPDLLIRTGGEIRISNFLLWHIPYTEFWVTPVFWPDFRREHLHQAIYDFSRRQRRFGGVLE